MQVVYHKFYLYLYFIYNIIKKIHVIVTCIYHFFSIIHFYFLTITNLLLFFLEIDSIFSTTL